ncbi:MAG: GNAT family N-acetyltransferase [Candidatus Sericytochromatia bacterium]|nr:GNAT family N-acetyltransferase [Candidatus Sericytochromatia bacterium]
MTTSHVAVSDDVQIRYATEEDLPGIVAVYGQSYPSPDFQADWVSQRFRTNERFGFADSVILAEMAGQIVGMLIVMPLEAFTPGGGLVPMHGVSTLAVSPVHRGLGLGSRLMRWSLQKAHDNGVPIISGFPYEYRYYSRFGYAAVGRAEHYSFTPTILPLFPERRHVRLLNEDDIAEVQVCHETYHRQRGTLSPRRSETAWQTWWPWYRFQAIGYPAEGPLEGLLLYEYKSITDQRLQHEAVIRDFVALTPAAERGLYGYLAGMADQVRTISMAVPVGDPLPMLWQEQRLADSKSVRRGDYTTGETLVNLFLRITHVPAAMTGRTYNGQDGQLTLACSDPDLAANEQALGLTFTAGVATIGAPVSAAPVLVCDIHTLAQIWSGSLAPSVAARWGTLELSDEALLPWLDAVFATASPPFIPDYDTF